MDSAGSENELLGDSSEWSSEGATRRSSKRRREHGELRQAGRQLRAMLHKNVLLKARNPCVTFCEILSPVLLVYVLVLGYTLSDVDLFPAMIYAGGKVDALVPLQLAGLRPLAPPPEDAGGGGVSPMGGGKGDGRRALMEMGMNAALDAPHMMRHAGGGGGGGGGDEEEDENEDEEADGAALRALLDAVGLGEVATPCPGCPPMPVMPRLDAAAAARAPTRRLADPTLAPTPGSSSDRRRRRRRATPAPSPGGGLASGNVQISDLYDTRRALNDVLTGPLPIPTFDQFVGIYRLLNGTLSDYARGRLLVANWYGRAFGNLLTLGALHFAPDGPATRECIAHLNATHGNFRYERLFVPRPDQYFSRLLPTHPRFFPLPLTRSSTCCNTPGTSRHTFTPARRRRSRRSSPPPTGSARGPSWCSTPSRRSASTTRCASTTVRCPTRTGSSSGSRAASTRTTSATSRPGS
jgi:hypothetical protein